MIKNFIFNIVLIFLLLAVNNICVYAFRNIKKGDKAASFVANKITGDSFSLDTILGKKAFVLFFWKLDLTRVAKDGEASGKVYDAGTKWVQEIAFLQKMSDSYKANGLEIIGVIAPMKSIFDKQNNIVRNPDFSSEEIDEIKKYLSENGINFTMVQDQGLNIYNTYGIVPFPSTAIVNPEGTLTYEMASYPTFGAETLLEDNIKIALGLAKTTSGPALAEKYVPKGKASIFYKNAVQLKEKDKTDKAIEELKSAIKEDPQYVDPHKMLVQFYEEKKDKENAMVEYLTIIELEPLNPLNHVLYGDFSRESGMMDDAKKEYDLAIQGDTTGTSYIGRSGEVQIRKRKIASGDAYYGLGMIAIKDNKKDIAFEYFTKALAYFAGNTSEGDMFSQFSQAKEIHPNQPRAHYELGMIYLEKGEEDKAIKEFKDGINAYQTIIKKLLKQKWN